MSDLEDAQGQVAAWLQPLPDESAPAGPDVEYDNDFLALTQAAQGKPESQFGPAEPPDWLTVRSGAESLFERTRDLRVAVYWLRAGLHLYGYRVLPVALQLVTGLIEQMWDHVHPLPDDGDPYARINALTVLREVDGVIGDLRSTRVVQDRAVGEMTGRAVELAAGLAQPLDDEDAPGTETLRRMMAAAVERDPSLATAVQDAQGAVTHLQSVVSERLDSWGAPDMRPLAAFAKAVVELLPAAAEDEAPVEGEGASEGAPVRGRGLSGAVNTREEALRAIDMVCEYLERAEPSNPAPLFLRRARQLVNHNFLQLMKELAPSVMPDLARMVGVDPDTVETPENP